MEPLIGAGGMSHVVYRILEMALMAPAIKDMMSHVTPKIYHVNYKKYPMLCHLFSFSKFHATMLHVRCGFEGGGPDVACLCHLIFFLSPVDFEKCQCPMPP